VDLTDKSFILISGPKSVTGVKRRRVNLNHVQALQDKIEVKRGASDEEVAKVLKSSGKLDFMAEPAKSASG
jgi:large subunit ribosomal protein L14e